MDMKMEILDIKLEILDTNLEILDTKMEILDTKMEMSKNADKYFACAICKKIYKTSSGLWKHSKKCNSADGLNYNANACVCGKTYVNNSGLWKHMKKCDYSKKYCKDHLQLPTVAAVVSNEPLTQAIMSMMKQNQEFQAQLLEIAKEGKQIIHNNTTTNNVNKNTTNNFNLNVFLNEQCKDALNMMDFIKSLRLQLTDLEETGRLGHSDGISRIFVNGLKVLDINKRPIHCSDLKREILYIKEGNVWEKDNENKTLIKRAINQVENKNISQIPLWVKAHPECADGSSRENTKYLKMVMQSTGGDLTNGDNNINKIIKNIAKETMIDKN